MTVRRLAAGILAVALLAASRLPADAATIVVHAYDEAGTLLSFDAFLDRTTVGNKGWRNDLLYRIADGSAVQHHPIYDLAGAPAFDTSGPGIGLSFAWRTENTGYSTLFLDNGAAGFSASETINLNYRAALDYRRKLDDALARRPGFVPTSAFLSRDARAHALLTAATAAPDEPTRGVLALQSLDALAQAFEALLHDYGLQRARTLTLGEWWGVTADRLNRYPEMVASVAALVENDPARARMRIVFDEGVPATDYDAMVDAALTAGIDVVGQILDSSAMSSVALPAFQDRVREYVDHFPQIDVWEIGNEVNGEWLGPDVVAKLAFAADYVRSADPSDTTMLTFYWQMGTAGSAATALFPWIADNVTPALADDIDVVALSSWPGDAPLGIAHDEVFERLHAIFPDQQIAMGELGYWTPGTSKVWWWRSENAPTTTVRNALAEDMYLANLAFPYGSGGVFWWYSFQEMLGGTPLWATVNEAYRSIYRCPDADGDTWCDFQDNCAGIANPDQSDGDDDGLGDVCDLTCPSGERFDLKKIVMKLGAGPTDRLKIKGAFTSTETLDLVGDGLAVELTSDGMPLLDVQLGGPAAPIPFLRAPSGTFVYLDPAGQVAGVRKVLVKPKGPLPGTWSFRLVGKGMDLSPPGTADARLLLDATSTCIETHASELSCALAAGGAKLICKGS